MVRRFDLKGGIGKSAVELARGLRKRGHRVRVFAQKSDPEISAELGSDFERLAGPGFDPTLSMLWFARSAERVVERLRREGSVDVTVGLDHSTLQDVFRLGGGVHAEYLEATADIKTRSGGFMLDRIASSLERTRLAAGRFRALVAVSRKGRDDLLRHYPHLDPAAVSTIRNGVDLSRYSPDAQPGERAALRAQWGVGPLEPVALLVGQNPLMKGLDLAAEATRRAGLRLVYVGGGPVRPKWVPSQVVWAGTQAHVGASYRSADVLIAPSRYENFGNAVLEAAACGLPSVAPRWFGSSEILAECGAGELLVDDPRDIDGLAGQLTRAVDRDDRPKWAAAALAAARSGLASPERWLNEMEAVLTEAANQG